jgi:hypothetical protein
MADSPLDRRDLLKLAGGVWLAGAQEGCATEPKPPAASAADIASRLDPAAADALLEKIDRRLDWIDRTTLPDDVLPRTALERSTVSDRARCDALVRKSIRTLYMTGCFLDMPDEMKVHPGTQDRMRAMQPEMDEAVLGITDYLERMTPDDHKRVQDYLRKDDRFAEGLGRLLEKTAADDGLTFERSFGARATTLQLAQRMSAQSPSLVIDPIVRKVRRIEAHPRTDAEEARRLAARVGEEAFWESQERIERLHTAWLIRLGSTSGVSGTADPPSTTGQKTLSAGGITMGLGLGSVILGLIFAGLSSATASHALIYPALFFGVTLGPILLVVGLLIVIIGAIIRASE